MIEVNNQTRTKIDIRYIKEIVQNFLDYYQVSQKEVSIAFVGDQTIRSLNKKYRSQDKTTDVLSFSSNDYNDLGEVVINLAQIKKQAIRLKQGFKQELNFILVHGLLHLLGYDDQTSRGADEMYRLGNDFIKQISKETSNNPE